MYISVTVIMLWISRMLSMWISTITERFMQFRPQTLKTATTVLNSKNYVIYIVMVLYFSTDLFEP